MFDSMDCAEQRHIVLIVRGDHLESNYHTWCQQRSARLSRQAQHIRYSMIKMLEPVKLSRTSIMSTNYVITINVGARNHMRQWYLRWWIWNELGSWTLENRAHAEPLTPEELLPLRSERTIFTSLMHHEKAMYVSVVLGRQMMANSVMIYCSTILNYWKIASSRIQLSQANWSAKTCSIPTRSWSWAEIGGMHRNNPTG